MDVDIKGFFNVEFEDGKIIRLNMVGPLEITEDFYIVPTPVGVARVERIGVRFSIMQPVAKPPKEPTIH